MGLLDDIASTGRQLVSWVGTSDEDVPFESMHKALTEGGLAQPTEEKPRALFHDPYSVMDWGGWRQRPSSLTYESLRQMSVQNTVIAAIITLRTNQLAQFARPQQGVYDKGYRIVLRDRRDNAKSMTTQEQKMAAELEAMLETTAFLLPDERPSDRDSFRTFLKKGVRDTLVYDQFCFEKIRDRAGRPSRFVCLPGETIRPAVADVEHMTPEQLRDRVSYVQVYDNTVISEFGVDDLAWCIMNPRSDLRTNGFGFAPTEQIVRLVTAWLYGFEYNTRFFTQGSAVKGVLNIKGAIPDRQLRAFRRMWYTMISGVQNAWKTPILNSEDIQWISMHANNREMEYGSWMDWLTKLTCAIYGIDPTEINFIFGNTGQKGGLNQSRPNAEEVVESKDKGLTPLADHIADAINRHLIWEMAPELEFSFTGLDAKAEKNERERRTVEVEKWKMVDEIREEQDLPPMPNGEGQVILNPVWLQAKQGAEAMAGGGDDLGEGETDGSEDDHGDMFDDDDEDMFGGADDDEDFGSSQDTALAASAAVRALIGEELRKARRSETVSDGQRHIEIALPEIDP
jgi:phage portal protein BeeE